MTTEALVVQAKINPLIRPFLVLKIGFVMMFTIIGIPFALIWFLGDGRWWAQHCYDKIECQPTETSPRYRKGILIQVEKTIPFENIQDVTFVEGPILRRFQLRTLKFETAGHSTGQASDMHLTGIMDAHECRARIFAAWTALRSQPRALPAASAAQDSMAAAQLAARQGIEKKLGDMIAVLKEKK